jgi:hypothetical protein
MSSFSKCNVGTNNICDCKEKIVLKREDAEIKPQKKKCYFCSKKLGVFGIECRCGELFCTKHRHPEDHNCKFDFKSHDKEILKNNVVGGGEFEKISKI